MTSKKGIKEMKRTVKQIAKEYGKGWDFRVFDIHENYLYTVTTDEILISNDEKFNCFVEIFSESKIYMHLVYINLINDNKIGLTSL